MHFDLMSVSMTMYEPPLSKGKCVDIEYTFIKEMYFQPLSRPKSWDEDVNYET